MSDSSAHAPPGPRDPLTRLRLRANRSERGRKVAFGVQRGLVLGCVMGFSHFLWHDSGLWAALLSGAVTGVFFGAAMGLFATPPRTLRDPATDTDVPPEVARAATDRLIIGRPGNDAEANRVAALQAERVLSARSPRTLVAVLSSIAAVCALGVLALPSDGASDFPRALLGTIALACVLTPALLLPVRMFHRRRGRRFLEAHDPTRRD
ncbi:hypothetical protein CQJ94_15400 [Glycomyces fuscus]|nr:hypothetical protein CQJ94_15400 [Glycomyces fuscus]